jgi:hypothetical protein
MPPLLASVPFFLIIDCFLLLKAASAGSLPPGWVKMFF